MVKVLPTEQRTWATFIWSMHEDPWLGPRWGGMSQHMAPHLVWLVCRLDFEEQLEDLMGQHKDLWKFHVSHPKPFLPPFTSSLAVPGPKLMIMLQASFLSSATPSS